MSYELIAILMFSSMMLMLMTGQRVFGAIGFIAVVAALGRQYWLGRLFGQRQQPGVGGIFAQREEGTVRPGGDSGATNLEHAKRKRWWWVGDRSTANNDQPLPRQFRRGAGGQRSSYDAVRCHIVQQLFVLSTVHRTNANNEGQTETKALTGRTYCKPSRVRRLPQQTQNMFALKQQQRQYIAKKQNNTRQGKRLSTKKNRN